MGQKINSIVSIFFIFALSLFTTPLFASGSQEQTPPADESAQTFSFTDSRGITIELEAKPLRIISLGPNITETIYALGKEQLLVGRTDFCDYPAEVSKISSVGGLQDPSLETIVSLNPDLVIGSTHVDPEVLKKLESYSIPSALIYGEESFEGMEEVISGCAQLLDAESEGKALLDDIHSRKAALEASVAAMDKNPSCYYALGFGDGGDWTSGGNTFISELLGMSGGSNIAEDQEGWSYSKELLVARQPQLILVNKGMKNDFLTLPVYKDLVAAQNGHVFEIDENILVRQGPRQIDALEQIHRIMELVP